jgi:MFS family permease
MGASAGFLYPLFVQRLARAFPPNRRGMAMGLYEASFGIGSLTGLALFPAIAPTIGFSGTFAFMGFLAFTSAAITYRLNPSHASNARQSGNNLANLHVETARSVDPRAPFDRLSIGRRLMGLVSLSFLGSLAVDGLLGWLSTYYRLKLGFGIQETALLMALTMVGYILSSSVAGIFSDRFGRISIISTGSLILAIALVLLMVTQREARLFGVAALLGLGMGSSLAPMTALVTELFGPQRAGVTAGMGAIAGQAGQFAGGVAFGHLVDMTGSFQIVWLLAIGCLLLRIFSGRLLSQDL